MQRKRIIASWVLLAVFLPMLVLSSVHVHDSANLFEEECNECVHHHCHGHLGELTTTMHACVLCQFLTLPLVATGFLTVVYYNSVSRIQHAQCQGDIRLKTCGIPQFRAPPFV